MRGVPLDAAAAVPPTLSRPRGTVLALVAAASVAATSFAGRRITARPVRDWYPSLAKPFFNPPNWAFPVAWSLLFVLMGIAFWRVLRTPGRTRGRRLAVIVPFWLLILATIRAFRVVDRAAAWLLAPYAAWVAFATALNLAIVHMN